MMIFDGQVVCKAAFYQLYGFGKTLFFEYQKRYNDGAKVGFHWGTGLQKPTENMMLGVSFMRKILESASEPQPHLHYKGKHRTDSTYFKLPACYTKPAVFKELQALMETHMVPPISRSSFHKAWRQHFENFSIYKQSAFAKCSTCISLKERLSKEGRPEARQKIMNERSIHLAHSQSRRTVYYTNRVYANMFPETYLSIIHDKMDQAKTGIPRLLEISKEFSSGCQPLPIALTGMLVHGRDAGAFGHFSLTGMWPSDPNFTITSLAKCLRDLEAWDGVRSGDLAINSTVGVKNPLVKALLNPEPFTSGYMADNHLTLDHFADRGDMPHENLPELGSFKPLPRKLLLQLDNSGKDNKNKHVFAFCSELVARGVFETVEVGFLMVGHTHEDVDALFSKVSAALRHKEVDNLHRLMSIFWGCQTTHPVPSFVQEVADYKSYSRDFAKLMVGQSAPISFRFSMRENVPIFQYKEHLSANWLPISGRPVWRVDPTTKKPMLPQGQPQAVPISNDLRRRPDVISFVEKYIAWKEKNACDITSKAYSDLSALRSYWESILDMLKSGGEQDLNGDTSSRQVSEDLLQDFWPRTNHGTGYQVEGQCDQEGEAHPLEEEQADGLQDADEIFVGDPKDRRVVDFNPAIHIKLDEMVLVRPSDEWEKTVKNSVWLGRALSKVDMNRQSSHYGQFKVEWWRPVVKSRPNMVVSDVVRYRNFSIQSRQWEKEPMISNGETYVDGGAAIYSWTPPGVLPKTKLKLSPGALVSLKEYLNRLT